MSSHSPSTLALLLCSVFIAACTSFDAGQLAVSSKFEPIPSSFKHVWDKETHPFTGAAVIDIEGDGKFEIFVGGGEGQDDALLSYVDGELIDIVSNTGLSNRSATYGSTAIDMDSDGDTDLLVARDDGIYLYLNENGHFTMRRIQVDLPTDSVPFSVSVADIDRDGDADLYISTFVSFSKFRSATFNDPEHAKTNIMLLNNGDLNFEDITASSGTAGKNNTFFSVFVDLDNDGWQDLVLAQNTGVVEVLRNMKNQTFDTVQTSEKLGFWMGVGIGDIDQDGDQDLFFPNVGTSIPEFLTRGDLRDDQVHTHDWLLWRNEGEFNFTDVTEAYGLKRQGFGWGGVFEDVNLDGQLDLFVAQNYIKWPLHKLFKLPGGTYLQNRQGDTATFNNAPSLGLKNKYFGQSSIIVDLDADGRQDYLWLNNNGPIRAFLNTSAGNYLTVVLPDNISALGTRVSIETDLGQSYVREGVSGAGMLTDQTPEMSFGLGDAKQIKRVVVQRGQRIKTILAPAINSKVVVD